MAYGKISDKQREILEFMKNEILNKGYPPTVRDICEAVNLKSTSSVHSHLETLEKNGYIRRDPTKPRAIEIIDDNFNLTRREVVMYLWLGTWLQVNLFLQRRISRIIFLFPQSICLISSRLC